MASAVTPLAADGRGPRSSGGSPDAIGSNLSLKSGAGRRQRISRDFLIDMHRLRVLAKVVEPRKPTSTMTLEGSFASMFPAAVNECPSSGPMLLHT